MSRPGSGRTMSRQAPEGPGTSPRREPAVTRQARTVEELEAERAIVVARLAGAAFAVYMVGTYDAQPYPAGVELAGYALAVVLVASCLPVLLALRRISSLRAARALGLSTLVLDAAVLIAFVWLYAFDDTSVHFLLFFVLPAEAALKFRLVGAIAAWMVSTGAYVGRAVWAHEQYGYAVNYPSIAFRMGILLLVALIMGLFAQRMARHAEALRQTLARLEAEEGWRSALIDMLAHDLRSPIGTASTALEMLRHNGAGFDEHQTAELLSSALRQNRQALSLTDDLLELARARQGHLELRREPVDLRGALDRAIEQLGGATDWVTADVREHATAQLDGARLHQILVNLLSNARKHGRPPVEVRVVVDDEATVIRVTDHGQGLSEEHRRTVFEPLHGGPRADSVGLGLWIVHTLAVAHGGGAAYTTTDGLPTFEVRLPHADLASTEQPRRRTR